MQHFILKQMNAPSSKHCIVPSLRCGSKTDLNRYKKIEIIPCILSDLHGLRLVFRTTTKKRNPTYIWRLKNAPLNDIFVKEDIQK